ncbi:FHA domain-containing protein [Microcoleus sp. FACHB-SPT15]|uniref:FHA domain-containing protein n=1 Tax=Microcoleus sp. FACHB-SPT15 TaxID=2692830 RepID=UPI0017801F78|nr:FHA domain-containing protein [Microcoleus sp. FACHB-SPT15]MBD1803880.1 FHA domain-containing protein [Microcoleus sp. FACHB-SPT15]
MKLKLFLEQTGQSWTIKPNREYVIGSSSDCDIPLPYVNVVSDRHLKFSFNQLTTSWHVYDLGSSNSTFVNNQPITDYPIKAQTRIAIAGGIVLVATPEGSETNGHQQTTTSIANTQTAPAVPVPPPLYSSSTQHPNSVTPTRGLVRPNVQEPVSASDNSGAAIFDQFITTRSPIQEPGVRGQTSPLKVLNWKHYVDEQVEKQPDGLSRLATRFYMVTGFRNTPWIRAYGSKDNGFNAFDGYIIPDFNESAETVAAVIEEKLGQMRQYEETDCFEARLTDAHIADSATQSFMGVELFPIRRGRSPRGDYRRFCVVSYHRVRTYLLVENYGSDLFVSWITRFEPEPTPAIMGLWLFVAIVLTLFTFATQNLFLICTPLVIWSEIYLLVPSIMQSMEIVPKKANARLVTACVLLPTLFLLLFLGGATAMAMSNFF